MCYGKKSFPFQAIGKGGLASSLVLLRQVILFIPLVLILPRFMGVTGVWVGLPATDLIIFLIAAFLLVVEFRKLSGLEKKELATKKLII